MCIAADINIIVMLSQKYIDSLYAKTVCMLSVNNHNSRLKFLSETLQRVN